jgi:hypothetical protein
LISLAWRPVSAIPASAPTPGRRFCYPHANMSALNGDKARFHRERKAKIARRERSQTLREKLSKKSEKRPRGRDL